MNEIIDAFRKYSEIFGGPLGDITEFEHITDPAMHSIRQWEVVGWLQAAEVSGIKVTSWVALDDDDSFITNQKHFDIASQRAVICDSELGLTDDNAKEAIRILSEQIVTSITTD
mmetsp:Transcript_14582/g.16954  ORF Transcript_14582/g.16954 Transcript_14582/m.16954 type:complete len:114 (-) Transcript_14582:1886-2227(-)|eukprot:CAMPEP_0204857146 /NCGR_PEP_ID=MMETSP1347-20130617/20162_1 /ASSEMBLY_ACC=CAM_ASM_000690 /TAXON_ID=215587 /ORGANISM="Aplanochytrium stocchinoi, Strain GSBS06" /LENGTH=113 /DNA_ID=CAMNT_0052004367 /DNA_START=186 /DNA_END=527 /DNA_ORIENTATION=-